MPTTIRTTPEDPWQRERLYAAILDEVAASGWTHTTLPAVLARAGTDEAAFTHHFANLEQCFLDAYDSLSHLAYAHIMAAYRSAEGDWRASVRIALATLVRGTRARPQVALVCISQTRALGPAGEEHAQRAQGLLAEAVREMLADAPYAARVPKDAPLQIARAVWEALEQRLSSDETEPLRGLTDELLQRLRSMARGEAQVM